MQDRRKHKRFEVDDMDIHGKMIFASVVKIVNISLTGISIKADRRLDIGNEYSLKIDDRERPLSVKGVVVWSNICGSKETGHGDHIPLYAAGLKFTNVLSDRVTELLGFIEGHKTDQEQRVSGLRFRISDADSAVMNFPSAYLVKRISLGGMLIESTQSMNLDSAHPMEISLPDEEPVQFTGKVVSCIPVADKGTELYHLGIAFTNMPGKDAERLKKFILMLRDLNKAG